MQPFFSMILDKNNLRGNFKIVNNMWRFIIVLKLNIMFQCVKIFRKLSLGPIIQFLTIFHEAAWA